MKFGEKNFVTKHNSVGNGSVSFLKKNMEACLDRIVRREAFCLSSVDMHDRLLSGSQVCATATYTVQ